MDLIDLRERYEASDDFKYLKDPTTKYVVGRGSERPTVMLLSDAPNATENLEGKSVVGPTGRVLDQLMELAALSAKPDEIPNAYITCMLKYRTGVRGVMSSEVVKSLPWVRQEWRVLRRPPVIVTLGPHATKCLLGNKTQLGLILARPQTIVAGLTIWPMFHPRYPMYEEKMRPVCERHWEQLGDWLKEKGLI